MYSTKVLEEEASFLLPASHIHWRTSCITDKPYQEVVIDMYAFLPGVQAQYLPVQQSREWHRAKQRGDTHAVAEKGHVAL